MKAVWISPETDNCGISIYARNYTDALREHADVSVMDPVSLFSGSFRASDLLQNADIVHIQYETAFFIKNDHDYFLRIFTKVKKPIIVSLHEVYRDFPGVFPRSAISGSGLIKGVKRFIYDRKHPLQTAFRKHLGMNFGADLILVHHQYHKEILQVDNKNLNIEVLSHPVKVSADLPRFSWTPERPLHFGSTGFINPQYNYELLFSFLKQLDTDWRFTWAGGVRSREQQDLLNSIKIKISDNGWNDRFTITGWITEEEQTTLLREIDIYLAFFSSRSSSGSLTRAIGALKPVIATRIPLSEEIAGSELSPVVIVPHEPGAAADALNRLLSDTLFRKTLLNNVKDYADKNSYQSMASRMFSIYRKVTGK
ncbi:MAG: glycosyltransferase [Fibrobacter sp.]|nr:glycosyltransferase [Fibrobacter sp.]